MTESTLQSAGIDGDRIVVESFSQSSRITSFGGLTIAGGIHALSVSVLAHSVGVIGILDISRNGQTRKTAHIEPKLIAPQGSDDQTLSDQSTKSAPTYTDTYQPPTSHVS